MPDFFFFTGTRKNPCPFNPEPQQGIQAAAKKTSPGVL
jgi:hypothetical protein